MKTNLLKMKRTLNIHISFRINISPKYVAELSNMDKTYCKLQIICKQIIYFVAIPSCQIGRNYIIYKKLKASVNYTSFF